MFSTSRRSAVPNQQQNDERGDEALKRLRSETRQNSPSPIYHASQKSKSRRCAVLSHTDVGPSVVETVVSAHRFQRLSKNAFPDEHIPLRKLSSGSADVILSRADGVIVTLNIDKRKNWNTRISPGAWTRIITNVLSKSFPSFTHHLRASTQ